MCTLVLRFAECAKHSQSQWLAILQTRATFSVFRSQKSKRKNASICQSQHAITTCFSGNNPKQPHIVWARSESQPQWVGTSPMGNLFLSRSDARRIYAPTGLAASLASYTLSFLSLFLLEEGSPPKTRMKLSLLNP